MIRFFVFQIGFPRSCLHGLRILYWIQEKKTPSPSKVTPLLILTPCMPWPHLWLAPPAPPVHPPRPSYSLLCKHLAVICLKTMLAQTWPTHSLSLSLFSHSFLRSIQAHTLGYVPRSWALLPVSNPANRTLGGAVAVSESTSKEVFKIVVGLLHLWSISSKEKVILAVMRSHTRFYQRVELDVTDHSQKEKRRRPHNASKSCSHSEWLFLNFMQSQMWILALSTKGNVHLREGEYNSELSICVAARI